MSNQKQSDDGQKNLSFRDKLKVFQNISSQQPKSPSNNSNQSNTNNEKNQICTIKQEHRSQIDHKIEKNQDLNSPVIQTQLLKDKAEDVNSLQYNKTGQNNQETSINRMQKNENDIKNNGNMPFSTNQVSNSFKERMKFFQQSTVESKQIKTDLQGKSIKKNEEINSINQVKKDIKNEASNSFKDKMKIFQHSTNDIQQSIKELKSENGHNISTNKSFEKNNEQAILLNQGTENNREIMKDKSESNQESISIKDRMKVFQSLNETQQIKKETMNNSNNSQEKLNNINKDTINIESKNQENDKKKDINKEENKLNQISETSNSFKERLKLFQTGTTNIHKSNKDDENTKPQISSSFKDTMKVFQPETKEIDIEKKDEESKIIKITDKAQEKEEVNKKDRINLLSNIFNEKMKVFQTELYNEQLKDQNKTLSTQVVQEKKEDNIELNKSSQTNQSSNSFKERMKVFQPKSYNEQLKDQNKTSSKQVVQEKKEDNIELNKSSQTNQSSNSFKERMKVFQPKSYNEQLKDQNKTLSTQVVQEKKEDNIELNKSSQTNQSSNSFNERMKIFQTKPNENNAYTSDLINQNNKKKEENIQPKRTSNSFIEKSKIVGSFFNTQYDIPVKLENTDSKIVKEPQFQNVKGISQHFVINLYEEKKVIEKMEYIKNNIMNSITFFDKKYCIVLKNSFILFLKSIILEVLKRDKNLCESNLLSKVYLLKIVEMSRQMENISLFIDKVYKEKIHELEVDKKTEEETNNQDEIAANSMNYVMSEKESYKEISIQISCEANLNSLIPQDF